MRISYWARRFLSLSLVLTSLLPILSQESASASQNISTNAFSGSSVAFSPDSSTAWISENNSNVIKEVATATGLVERTVSVTGRTSVGGLQMSPDGSKLFLRGVNNFMSPSQSQYIDVLSTQTGSVLTSLALNTGNSVSFTLSPDGSVLWVYEGTSMVELNSSTGASIGTTAIASPCNIPTSATYQTTNGANIWFLSGTTVCTFNTVSLSVSTAIALSGSSYYIFTLSPNGLTFWVATYGAPSTIYQYSATSTPQLLKTISNSSTCYPYGMQVAPDSQSLWIGNLCGSATGIDIATPSLSTNISGMGTDVYGVAISPDGSQVWVYSANSVNELSYTPLIAYAGGTGVGTAPIQSSASAEVAGSFSVAANTFTKTGYTFLGWTDGSTTYQPGSTYTMSTTNVTLTAVWASPPIQYSKPTAPLSVSAQLNGNAATISFTPGSTGNLATYNEIDMYVNGAPTGDVCNVAIIATCVVGNLAPNTTYTFSITATNNLGSATSVISNAVSYAAPTTTTTTTVPVTTTTVASTHTIICVKGNAMKKVTGVNPVCPSGFKRK